MQNRLHLLNAEELMVNMRDSLIQKYNVPGPRYTSYPTVPYWEEDAVFFRAMETDAENIVC